jgi:hypothetical protein
VFEDEGLADNAADPYDPLNGSIADVMDSRRGALPAGLQESCRGRVPCSYQCATKQAVHGCARNMCRRTFVSPTRLKLDFNIAEHCPAAAAVLNTGVLQATSTPWRSSTCTLLRHSACHVLWWGHQSTSSSGWDSQPATGRPATPVVCMTVLRSW